MTNGSSALVYAIEAEDELSTAHVTDRALTQDELSTNGETHFNTNALRNPLSYPIHYRSPLNTIIKALRLWPAAYCISCQPFQVCTLLGPYASHLQATFVAPSTRRGDLERDLIHEIIACIAEYWGIGAATLGNASHSRRCNHCVF
jgi:hypothetical protein